jgi:hypothetical protein
MDLETLIKANPPTNSIELIRLVKEYVKRTELIVPTLERIAAGQDGISGTDDDLISQDVIQDIKSLMRLRVVEHIASEINIQKCCFF